MKPHTSSALVTTDPSKLPRFLAYALPRSRNDGEVRVKTFDEFAVDDVPLGATASFLDYEGIVLFAGAFEKVYKRIMDQPRIVCADPYDLDSREREFFSILQHNKLVIFGTVRQSRVNNLGDTLILPQN